MTKISFKDDGATFVTPFLPKYLGTRSGGEVRQVIGCGHELFRPQGGRSRDDWHFVCVIRYSDESGIERQRNCHPGELIYSAAFDGPGLDEMRVLDAAMMDYLSRNGEWRESVPRGWYANRTNDAVVRVRP